MAIRHLRYEIQNSGTSGVETSHYVDLARDLSAINRQLMRQGRVYRVKRVSVVSSNTIASSTMPSAGFISASVIPTGWVQRNAWKRGFDAWNKMRKSAVKASGSSFPKARWADFKVRMSVDSTTGTQLVPKDNGGNQMQMGEWTYSEFTRPIDGGSFAGDTFLAHMIGDHLVDLQGNGIASVGLIRSYGETRYNLYAEPASNNLDSDSDDDPIATLFDSGQEVTQILEDYSLEGNLPPYYVSPVGGVGVGDHYIGGQTNMPKPIVVSHGTLGADGRCTLAGFDAMCGLIEFESKSPINNDVFSVLVELAEGQYKGVRAEVI